MYNRESEFTGCDFRKSLIQEESGISVQPVLSRNLTYNKISCIIHLVFRNIVFTYKLQENYVDWVDPQMGILAGASFAVHSTIHTREGYTLGQLVFFLAMFIPINHISDWKLVRQQKQEQTNYNNNRKNITRIEYDQKFKDKVIFRKQSAYKYKIPYKEPHKIIHCWKIDKATLHISPTTDKL